MNRRKFLKTIGASIGIGLGLPIGNLISNKVEKAKRWDITQHEVCMAHWEDYSLGITSIEDAQKLSKRKMMLTIKFNDSDFLQKAILKNKEKIQEIMRQHLRKML